MANGQENGPNGSQKITVSLQTLRQEIENALLKLQLELVKTYAAKSDIETLDRELKEMHKNQERLEEQLIALEKDKAGREAVRSFQKWLTGGGIIATVVLVLNLVVSIYFFTHGGSNANPTP